MSGAFMAIGTVGAAVVGGIAANSAADKAASAQEASAESLASSSDYAAQLANELGQAQLAEAQRQYDLSLPMAQQMSSAQVDMMESASQQSEQMLALQSEALNRSLALGEQEAARSQEYYDYMKDTYRPLEEQVVADAQAYNTQAKQNELASKAAADVQLASAQARAANERAMASMGINPNSGAYQATQAQLGLQEAGMAASAQTNARLMADEMGYARMADAIALGKGLPGASTGSSSLALNAANTSASTAGASGANMLNSAITASTSVLPTLTLPGQNLMSGLSQGTSTIMDGVGTQVTGLSNVLSNQTSVLNNTASPMTGAMQLMGTLGGAALGNSELFAPGGYLGPTLPTTPVG